MNNSPTLSEMLEGYKEYLSRGGFRLSEDLANGRADLTYLKSLEGLTAPEQVETLERNPYLGAPIFIGPTKIKWKLKRTSTFNGCNNGCLFCIQDKKSIVPSSAPHMFTAGNIRRWVEGLNEYERQTWSIHAFEPHFADEADADPLLSKDEVSGADLGDGVRYFVSCCKNAGVKKRLPSVWTAGYSPVREKTTSIGKEILRKVRSIDFSPVETKEDTIQVSYSLFRPEVAQAIIKYMHEPAKENLEAVRQICEQFGEMYVDVASSWNGIIPCVPRRFLEEWQIKDPNFPSLLKAIDVAQKNVWDRIILPRVEGIYTPGRDGVDWNESKNAQSSLQKCSRYYCNWQELGEAISPRRIRDYFLPVVSSVKRLFRRLG